MVSGNNIKNKESKENNILASSLCGKKEVDIKKSTVIDNSDSGSTISEEVGKRITQSTKIVVPKLSVQGISVTFSQTNKTKRE